MPEPDKSVWAHFRAARRSSALAEREDEHDESDDDEAGVGVGVGSSGKEGGGQHEFQRRSSMSGPREPTLTKPPLPSEPVLALARQAISELTAAGPSRVSPRSSRPRSMAASAEQKVCHVKSLL